MKIKLIKNITKDEKLCNEIKLMLEKYDNDFLPSLSSRNSSKQNNFNNENKENSIEKYFNSIKSNFFIVAFYKNHLAGFMSFEKDYNAKHVTNIENPCIYVTTIIVGEEYRGQHLTTDFYNKIFDKFKNYCVMTRTWSTNNAHIEILARNNFVECKRIENDRGNGIDTVYYIYKPLFINFFGKIKFYQLRTNFAFLVLLPIFTGISFVINIAFDNEIVDSIFSSVSTSLLASFLCLLCDTYIQYRDTQRDMYINNLKHFGINDLRFQKGNLLQKIIPEAKSEIWISGYRLIMTSSNSFLEALEKACQNKNKINIKILTVAPFSKTFKYVYGNEDVYLNYNKVFKTLYKYVDEDKISVVIKMTTIPIFNDTYKVDDRIVTGPYLHCCDENNNKKTAKDFFTLDITDKTSELYEIITNDYKSVWDDKNTYFFDLNNYNEDLKSKNIVSEAELLKKHTLNFIEIE